VPTLSRRATRGIVPILFLAAVAAPTLVFAQTTQPASRPAAEPLVGEMRVETLKGMAFLCVSGETTLKDISGSVRKMSVDLKKAIDDAKVQPDGGMVLIYHGVTMDPNQPFHLDVGYKVPKGTKAAGAAHVQELADYPCATVLYTGPIRGVGEAFQRLFPALFGAGHRPTEDLREYYLYWESPESPNNVILVTVGIDASM
jgi:effector-binding domain-containing protein